MAFNVSQFRDHFAKHGDYAKTSKFDVRVTAPPGLGLDATDLRFQCETTELPGYTINTVDGRYYGVANPVATFPTFGDLTLTFICSGDFWEKKLFDRWMNLVIPINNYNPNYKNVYTSSKIEINQFSETAIGGTAASPTAPGRAGFQFGDTTGATIPSTPAAANSRLSAQIIYKVAFFEAFPTAIAPMSVNWADDAIHRLVVTFRYEWWMTGDLEQDARSSGMINPTPAPRPQNNRTPSASGSTPPVADTRPTTLPQTTQPVKPIKGGGGTFAGGGASGSF